MSCLLCSRRSEISKQFRAVSKDLFLSYTHAKWNIRRQYMEMLKSQPERTIMIFLRRDACLGCFFYWFFLSFLSGCSTVGFIIVGLETFTNPFFTDPSLSLLSIFL